MRSMHSVWVLKVETRLRGVFSGLRAGEDPTLQIDESSQVTTGELNLDEHLLVSDL